MQNTELRETHIQLEQSLDRYIDLYDFAPVGYFTLTGNGTIQNVNFAGAALLDEVRAGLIDRRFGLFVAVPSRGVLNAFFNKMLTGELKVDCEIHLEKEPHRSLHLKGVRQFSENGWQCRIAALDITERKKAEFALQTSETMLHTIYDLLPVGISITDRSGEIVDCNRFSETLLGIIRDEHLRRNYAGPQWPLIRPDGTLMPSAEYASVRAMVEQQTVRNVEMGIACPEGVTWISVSATPAIHPDYGVIIAYVDVTERKKTEQALQKSNEQLAHTQKLKAIGQLTGGIAHDFNNLLTIIKGNLDLLYGQNQTDPDQRLILDDARSATRQSIELTSALLAFAHQQPLRVKPTRVNRLVENIGVILQRTLGPLITLRTDLDLQLPDILIDPNQLQAALLNLAFNARDAMPKGGTINVHTALVTLPGEINPPPTICGICPLGGVMPPSDLTPGRYVVVMIADTGCGMDKATLSRACEPFFTTKETGLGTGLGLSSVYGFVHQSQGGLVIQSRPGLGTCILIFLPAIIAGHEDLTPEAPATLVEGSVTILLVEDEPRVRRLSGRYLRDLGYEVLEATNAEEAIEILETEPNLQILFSDIAMPGKMDGYNLACWVAVHYPTVKCLLTTGYSKNTNVALADTYLRFPVLQKPYSCKQLAQHIALGRVQ
jgi:PAS domain S-box-containing protein